MLDFYISITDSGKLNWVCATNWRRRLRHLQLQNPSGVIGFMVQFGDAEWRGEIILSVSVTIQLIKQSRVRRPSKGKQRSTAIGLWYLVVSRVWVLCNPFYTSSILGLPPLQLSSFCLSWSTHFNTFSTSPLETLLGVGHLARDPEDMPENRLIDSACDGLNLHGNSWKLSLAICVTWRTPQTRW